MGTQREFNWILKINKLEEDIRNEMEGGIFIKGKKEGLRDYPEEPIIMVDKDWNAFAIVEKKMKIENSDYTTSYTFQLKRYLDNKEKEIFSSFYREFYNQ